MAARASDEGDAVGQRRLARFLRACGLEVQPNVDIPLQAAQNRELLVQIVPDTFQGNPRARVRAYRPMGSVARRGEPDPADRGVTEESTTPF